MIGKILLVLAGGVIGFWLGGMEMARGISRTWPDLYEEMVRRCEEE